MTSAAPEEANPDSPAIEGAGESAEQALEARVAALELALAVRRPSTWIGYLAPAAFLVAALIVAGAMLYTRTDDTQPVANAVAVGTPPPAPVSAPADVSGSAQNVLTAFTRYAAEIGLDSAKFGACMKKQDVSLIAAQLNQGIQLQVNGTPTFFINNKRLVGAQPPVVIDEIINAELKGSPTSLDSYSVEVQALARSNPPYFEILPTKPQVTGAIVEGSPNARVMIVEYTDFQCPFCKRWTQENLTRLRPRLGNDIALAFVNFPLEQIHPNAGYASLVGTCAAEQGKFWPMHDILFARQDEWANLRQ